VFLVKALTKNVLDNLVNGFICGKTPAYRNNMPYWAWSYLSHLPHFTFIKVLFLNRALTMPAGRSPNAGLRNCINEKNKIYTHAYFKKDFYRACVYHVSTFQLH